jgi:hypothetical protein
MANDNITLAIVECEEISLLSLCSDLMNPDLYECVPKRCNKDEANALKRRKTDEFGMI